MVELSQGSPKRQKYEEQCFYERAGTSTLENACPP